jgi:PTS system cellobiose-specific IIA component
MVFKESSMLDLEEAVMGLSSTPANRGVSVLRLCARPGWSVCRGRCLIGRSRRGRESGHSVQTKLIEADEGEGKTKMTLVMVHAQDHLMTSILCRELATELVEIYRRQAS